MIQYDFSSLLRILFFISVAIFIDRNLASNTIKRLSDRGMDPTKVNPLLNKDLDDFSKVKYIKDDLNYIIYLILFNVFVVLVQVISIIIILNMK